MRASVLFGLCAAVAMVTPAIAQDAAPAATTAAAPLKLAEGTLIVSADGRRIGRVEAIVGAPASPVSVTVIKDNQFATIPVSTLSAGDHGRVVTTLKYNDIL